VVGPLLCLAAFVTCYITSKRSLGSGLAAVITWGYSYGILRAYFADSGAYFIFDCALLGLYLAHFLRRTEPSNGWRTHDLRGWATILVVWPLLLVFLPFQPFLISLVGLRGNILAIPAVLIGAQLRDEDLSKLSVTLSILNIAVLIVAVLEYNFGLENFFPQNEVTTLMFRMNDVAHYTAYRIPATFSQAHVYAGTMISTIPFVFGAWAQIEKKRSKRVLVVFGMAAALLGILLAAARMAFVTAALIMTFATLKSRLDARKRRAMCVLVLCIAVTTLRNERLQRFTPLSDTKYVQERVAGSINRGFFEILFQYPMGNGLGGGGTSIPYFLQNYVKHAIGLESEYTRLLVEESIVGLLLWIGFILWVFTRPTAFAPTAWQDGRRLAWFTCLLSFSSGLVGIGLFTSIPSTVLLFSMIGWFSVRPASTANRLFSTTIHGAILQRNARVPMTRKPQPIEPKGLAQ
jgi:hypothetical protein